MASLFNSTPPVVQRKSERAYLSNWHQQTSVESESRPGSSFIESGAQQVICAVNESRGVSPVVGLAFLNTSTNEVVLCQITDSQSYARTIKKISVFEPSCMLLMSTAVESQMAKALQDQIEVTFFAIDRKYWTEANGLEQLEQLSFKNDIGALKTSMGGKFFAICCFSAAIRYFDLTAGVSFAKHSLRITYEPSEGAMMIDMSTVRSLELIQNLDNSKSKDCLFGLLNQTLTPMGSRLLRTHVLEPLTSIETLNSRLDALQELTEKEEMFLSVREALKLFQDTDKLLADMTRVPDERTLSTTESEMNNILILKAFVYACDTIVLSLQDAECGILAGLRDLCASTGISHVRNQIDQVINKDITFKSRPLDLRNQRTYAVKSGVNGMLDVARNTSEEARQQLMNAVAELKEQHNFEIEVKFDSTRHFYLCTPSSEIDHHDVPESFLNVIRIRTRVEYQTLQVLQLNQKIIDCQNEALMMSDKVVHTLTGKICEDISVLSKVSEGLAMLDMIASLAQVATTRDYVRPDFTTTMAVRSGRHPIAETLYSFVPNDIYATENNRFHVITGANMSGKSTYVRSIALLTVMAQMGSFVPAEYASFVIRHQLFARVSLDDSYEANLSTFSLEMRETASILDNLCENSLVVIDELGRGAGTRDGLAIALSIAEALIDSKALVWFTTHFQEIGQVLHNRIGVACAQFSITTDEDNMITTPFKLSNGLVSDFNYGMLVARTLPFPPGVIIVAEQVSSQLRQRTMDRKDRSSGVKSAQRRRLILELHEQLLQANEGALDGKDLETWLQNLQSDFVNRMSSLLSGSGDEVGH